MAVQQALMVHGLCGQLPPQHVWNIDASTMIIEDSGKGGQNYRVVSCHEADTWEAKLLKDPLTTTRFQSGLDMAMKWMHAGNGTGDFGRMILIISVPGIPVGSFYFADIQGLVFGPNSTLFGGLYLVASRCMPGLPDSTISVTDEASRPVNPWNHYYTDVLIPDITHYNDSYNIINPVTGERYGTVVSQDGEACVTRELMSPVVFTKLDVAHIDVMKNRPSGTAFDNPLDASDNFRDKNAGLKHCVTKNIDTSNDFLEQKLREAFAGMRLQFPENTMSAAHQKKAIDGAARFVWVCRSQYVNSQKQIVGFRRSGYIRVPGVPLTRAVFGHEDSKVDAHYIMNKLCHSTFEPEEMDLIYESFNEMTAIQRVEGRVTNAAMDRLGICKLPDGEHIDRDNNCLTQSGPVWMTHSEARAREAAWKVRDATAKAAKAVLDAEALLAKSVDDTNKRAAADVEKARVKGLTSEQKKADPACMSKAAKAKEVRDQKQDRDQKAAEAIAAAKTLLGIT
jgi:hypothetical protein